MRRTILLILTIFACLQSFSKEISNEDGTLKINYEAPDTLYDLDQRKVLISVKAAEQYKDLVVKVNGWELDAKGLGMYEYISKVYAFGSLEEVKYYCTTVVSAKDAKGDYVQIKYSDEFYVRSYEVSYKPETPFGYGIGILNQFSDSLGYKTRPHRRPFNMLIKFSDSEKVFIRPEKPVKDKDGFTYFKIPKLRGVGTAYIVDDDSALLAGSYRSIAILDDSTPKVSLKVGNKVISSTTLTSTDLSMLTMDCKFAVTDNNVVVNYEIYKNGKLLISSKTRGGPMGKGLDFVRKSHKAFTKGDKLILWVEGIQFRLPEKQETLEAESEGEYKERIIYNLYYPFRFEISVK